jgi:hypothetical protein
MWRYLFASGPLSALLAVVGLVLSAGASAGRPQEKNGPAWPGVFIKLGGYVATYQRPVVGKGEKPKAYQQKAIYHWTGGRFEVLEITLARDPAFKRKYAAAALRKEKAPPKELEINKKKAWLWELPREQGKLDRIARRLVVVLDGDKALIIEQKGSGAKLEDVARKFDFARIEKALAKPPS